MSDYENVLGPETDHYDASEVMDDVAPAQPAVSRDTQVRAVRAVVRQAQRLRLPPPELKIEPTTGNVGDYDIDDDDVLGTLIGVVGDEDSNKLAAFTPASSADFPITQNLYQKFQAATPAPKNVRVDTDDSYADFCSQGCAPTDDNRVPLSLEPWAEGTTNCWQDGGDIYVSIRMIAPDGKPRVLTSATPFAKHADEVLGYANDAGVDPLEVEGVLPSLAQVLGGGALVTQISRAAPALLAQPAVIAGKTFVGKVTPVSNPTVASIMALIQLCDKGSKRACAEAARLKVMIGGAELFQTAINRLSEAKKLLAVKGRV